MTNLYRVKLEINVKKHGQTVAAFLTRYVRACTRELADIEAHKIAGDWNDKHRTRKCIVYSVNFTEQAPYECLEEVK